ncbi:MAG: carboxypeptidase-like regulatory domain-containing protein [Bacteroidota bacterium]
MDSKKINIVYTAEDIHKYLSGKMNATEMHAIEKAALDDPLLAEAIEGYMDMPGFTDQTEFDKINNDLSELKKQINPSKVRRFTTAWRAAAAILLLLGGVILAMYLNNNFDSKKSLEVASKKVSTDSTKSIASIPKQHDSIVTTPVIEEKKEQVLIASNEKIKKETAASANVQSNNLSTDDAQVIAQVSDDIVQRDSVFDFNENIASATMDKEVAVATIRNQSRNFQNQSRNLQKATSQNIRPITFSGRVTDRNNNPISYTTITTERGLTSTTDKDGAFRLRITDTSQKIVFTAKNYNPKVLEIKPGYQNIILDSRKIISDKSRNSKAGQAVLLYHKGAAPVIGWPKYLNFLTSQISYSEYDTGEPVVGETILTFEIDSNLEFGNFTFEKQIDPDVNSAIEELVTNGPDWKIIDKTDLPALIRLKLIF